MRGRQSEREEGGRELEKDQLSNKENVKYRKNEGETEWEREGGGGQREWERRGKKDIRWKLPAIYLMPEQTPNEIMSPPPPPSPYQLS